MHGSNTVFSPTIRQEAAAAGLVSSFSLFCFLFLILHVMDVGTGYVNVLGLRVPLLMAMAGRSWMHFKRTPLIWATESAYRCCE